MKKIMIVDDEKISLTMTNHILSSEYQTVCCSSGREALEQYERERPDMILSDLRMPGMNGYELLEELKKNYDAGIPFMFMTADTGDDIEIRGFREGAMDFIRKPFRADVLLRRVGNILKTVERIAGLKKAAETDPMTGLLNKSSSRDEIGAAVRNTPGVLMMIDLDSFKPVNDIYGHDMGDKVLIRFAEIIKSSVRSTDIVGRMGGDEFIAYCKNVTDEDVVAGKAAYINEQLLISAKEFMGEDMSIPLGASLGCVCAPVEGNDFETLYKKADKALYQVKQNGKHDFAFYHESDLGMDDEEGAGSDIANIAHIMGERSPAKGAFLVSSEKFKTIYQFLCRMTHNYHRDVFLLMITLSETDMADLSLEKAIERFEEVLKSSLRQSDVITRNGSNQFLVMLMETTRTNIEVVTDRIESNWSRSAGSGGYSFTHELILLD